MKKVKKYKINEDPIVAMKRNLPQWTKTHPSSEKRFNDLKKWSTEVRKKYVGVI